MAGQIIEVAVEIHHETERALLVSDTGDREDAVWIPKSQIEAREEVSGVTEISLPEWLALEKGLI
jgi:hypothetical protein